MSFRNLVPGAGPVFDSTESAYRAAKKAGIKPTAYKMGLTADQLQKKLHIDNDHRGLTLYELDEFVRITKDLDLLAALVRPAGAIAYLPKPVPATKDALVAFGELLEREAEFFGTLHRGASDGHWLAHEAAELAYRADQVIAVLLGIVAGAWQAVEGADHG